MSPDDARWNRRLLVLVVASLALVSVLLVLRIGLGATGYETTDSLGRPMGFNDPLYLEHLVIMVRNFEPQKLLDWEHAYDWMLLGAHFAGFGMLLWGGSARATRWFFALQAIVFPFGALLFFIPFISLPSLFTGGWDREGFVDLPFSLVMCQPVWVVTSLVILFSMRGPGLGLANVWHALRQACRAGAQTYVATVR